MADTKAPEMAETFIDDLAFLLRLPVAEIRRPVMGLLKARLLAIVTEADRKVLKAWRELDRDDLRILQSMWTGAVSVCANSEIQRRDDELEARKTRAK